MPLAPLPDDPSVDLSCQEATLCWRSDSPYVAIAVLLPLRARRACPEEAVVPLYLCMVPVSILFFICTSLMVLRYGFGEKLVLIS